MMMFKHNRLFVIVGLLCLAGVIAITARGCGTSAPTVTGTVTVDGHPLENGSITFFPIEKTPGGTSGAAINQGKFEVSIGLT